LLLAVMVFSTTVRAAETPEQTDLYGVVVKIEEIRFSPLERLLRAAGENTRRQRVTIKLDATRAPDAPGVPLPKVVTAENALEDNPAYNIPLRPGARVLLTLETNPANGRRTFYIVNRDRTPALMILGTTALLALLLIGGSAVARHALLVVLMMVGVYQFLFPAILAGRGAIIPLAAMCLAFPVLAGLIHSADDPTRDIRASRREQVVIAAGVLGGTGLLALIVWIMGVITPLSGFSSEGLAELWARSPGIDAWLLYVAGVLIAFQGLLFYLCRLLVRERQADAASGLSGPAAEESPIMAFSARFRLVMRRGRGLLGPLISSLGLLCLGLFLPILLQLEGTPAAQFINLESTASLFIFAFAGGLTLILAVPLTALLVALSHSKKGPGK
jgi:uncharacterized membrane protein